MRRVLLGPLFSLSLSAERQLVRQRRRTGQRWDEILRDGLPEAGGVAGLLSDPAWAITEPAAAGFWTAWTTIPQFEQMVSDPDLVEFRMAWAAFSQALDRQFERDPSVTLARYQQLSDSEDFEASPLLALHRPGRDQLTLTTLHQAKGLEFDVVFIADAAEGSFPDLRRTAALLHPEMLSPDLARSPEASTRFRLQEEMRLAYTAMTRARQRVVWTATSAAIDEGERRPSRFMLAASGHSSFRDIGSPPDAARSTATDHLGRGASDVAPHPDRSFGAGRRAAERPVDALRSSLGGPLVGRDFRRGPRAWTRHAESFRRHFDFPRLRPRPTTAAPASTRSSAGSAPATPSPLTPTTGL